jgi:hypothetical protein
MKSSSATLKSYFIFIHIYCYYISHTNKRQNRQELSKLTKTYQLSSRIYKNVQINLCISSLSNILSQSDIVDVGELSGALSLFIYPLSTKNII